MRTVPLEGRQRPAGKRECMGRPPERSAGNRSASSVLLASADPAVDGRTLRLPAESFAIVGTGM
jgi:hypothetical protein